MKTNQSQTLPTINALHFIAAVEEADVILHEETRRTKIFRAIAKTGKTGATVEEIAKATKLDPKEVKADVYTLARLMRVTAKH